VRWNASVAAGLAGAALAEMLLGGVRSALFVVCGVCAALALAARGRAPLGAPALTLAAFAVPVVAVGRQLPSLGQPPNSFALTAVMLLAAYTTGTHAQLRRAVCGLVLVGAVSVLYAVGPGSPRGSTLNDMLAAALFSAVVPWLAGFAVARQRRARAADRLFEESRAAAAAERARIARDVHDLVAHTVSLMAVQAEAAEALLPTSPERTAEYLRVVQAARRDALGLAQDRPRPRQGKIRDLLGGRSAFISMGSEPPSRPSGPHGVPNQQSLRKPPAALSEATSAQSAARQRRSRTR
jgi:signal transduction histidine kinase